MNPKEASNSHLLPYRVAAESCFRDHKLHNTNISFLLSDNFYQIDSNFLGSQVGTNSVDPDQTGPEGSV